MQRVEWRRDIARHFIHQFDALAVAFNRCGLRWVTGKTAAVIPDEVHKDAEQPGFELALIIIAAQALDDAEEGLLHEVLREFRVVGGTERVTKEALPVGVDQRIPSGTIASLAFR